MGRISIVKQWIKEEHLIQKKQWQTWLYKTKFDQHLRHFKTSLTCDWYTKLITNEKRNPSSTNINSVRIKDGWLFVLGYFKSPENKGFFSTMNERFYLHIFIPNSTQSVEIVHSKDLVECLLVRSPLLLSSSIEVFGHLNAAVHIHEFVIVDSEHSGPFSVLLAFLHCLFQTVAFNQSAISLLINNLNNISTDWIT